MILYERRILENLNSYDVIDQSLITSRDFIRNFGTEEDYVEAHVYSANNRLINSNYNFTEYKIPGSLKAENTTTTNYLEVSPGNLIKEIGLISGKFKVVYNVLRKKVINTNTKVFFIKSISSDRTELKIVSNTISDLSIQEGTLNFINEIQNTGYYKDFLLNFGDNKLVNAVNIALDATISPYAILIKLYRPLPQEFSEKASFWIVEEMSTPIVFEVEITPDVIVQKPPYLSSANFNIDLDYKANTLSDYYNKTTLVSNSSSFAYQELLNRLKNKGITINVDYTKYDDFIHFSSATTRLVNFVKKVEKIEQYNSNINYLKTIPNYISSSNVIKDIQKTQTQISDLVIGFDDYEKYLYYESSSKAWPKYGSQKPYFLYPVNSPQGEAWLGSIDYNSRYYGGEIYSASLYDNENQNNLIYSIPEYLRMDENNRQYERFVDMMGQYFDSIWLYIKAITDLPKAKNNINKGISKDLVYYALRSLGIKLYNSKANEDLYSYFIGSNPSGSYINTSDSYSTYVSASKDKIPGEQIQKEVLKRIYHNLPGLLKKKGTNDGIDDLIGVYGIPYTILAPVQYGGSDKTNQTVEYVYDRFSYCLYNTGSSFVKVPWNSLYAPSLPVFSSYVPDAIELRFKPDKDTYYRTSSIIEVMDTGSTNRSFGVLLRPDAAQGYPYSKIDFYLSGTQGTYSSSISLPIYHEDVSGEVYWWNILLKRSTHTNFTQNTTNQTYTIVVANKIDTYIGHQASSSIYVVGAVSSSYNYAWSNPNQSLYVGGTNVSADNNFQPEFSFVGNFQELRYWSTPLSQSKFFYHVLNPESVEGNTKESSYNDLSARFALGNDLKYYNHATASSAASIHPNQNYRVFYNQSINQSASFNNYINTINYFSNIEECVTNSPNTVYSIPVNKKVRIQNNTITGSLLSTFLKLEEDTLENYTRDLHYTDVSFSPQNEVNKDIIAYYGNNINVDNIIGDPKYAQSSSYSELEVLNGEYYKKYSSRYNYKDFVRLIQFYDNALFKMILDFVPGRDNTITGLTIKSPIIERSKAKVPPVTGDSKYNDFSVSITGSNIKGDSIYISGIPDGRDFYLGELQGSLIDVKTLFLEKNRNPYLWP